MALPKEDRKYVIAMEGLIITAVFVCPYINDKDNDKVEPNKQQHSNISSYCVAYILFKILVFF